MDPRDVNRINYNNYYVGQNLDFLVRSKMRSESLSTPLKNTPAFYDDQVNTKMSLLGKRGYYDPAYIYGFSNQDQDIENYQDKTDKYINRNNDDYNPVLTKEQYNQIILPKEHYKEQLMNENEMNNNYQKYSNQRNPNQNILMNNNINNNINKYNDEILYKEKMAAYLKERQTPQKLDNFQLERINPNYQKKEEEQGNVNNPNNLNNNLEERRIEEEPKYINDLKDEEREYYEQMRLNNNMMVRNQDKIPNQDYFQQINEYNYINELAKKNTGSMTLPLTRNQILQGVLTENFNRKHFSNK